MWILQKRPNLWANIIHPHARLHKGQAASLYYGITYASYVELRIKHTHEQIIYCHAHRCQLPHALLSHSSRTNSTTDRGTGRWERVKKHSKGLRNVISTRTGSCYAPAGLPQLSPGFQLCSLASQTSDTLEIETTSGSGSLMTGHFKYGKHAAMWVAFFLVFVSAR